MAARRQALVILDLLSYQGAVDHTPFDVAAECLASGLVDPSLLFVFSDLSALATGLLPPLDPALSPTQRLVAVLGRRGAAPGPAAVAARKGAGVAALLHHADAAAERLAPLVEHALLPGAPGHAQCHLGGLPHGEALQRALQAWLTDTVAPRLAGCSVLACLYTHGGFGRVHSATEARGSGGASGASHCLPDYAIAGLASGGAGRWEPENFSMAWVGERLVLPLARAVGSAGSLTWLQGTCYAPALLRSLAGALQARTGLAPGCPSGCPPSSSSGSGSGSGEGASAADSSCSSAKRAKISPAALPRLVLVCEKPLYSPLQDANTSFGQGELRLGDGAARCPP